MSATGFCTIEVPFVSIPSLMGRLLGCSFTANAASSVLLVSIPSLMGRLLGSGGRTQFVIIGIVSIPSLMGRLLGYQKALTETKCLASLNTLADGQAPRIPRSPTRAMRTLMSQYPR